MTTQIQNGSIAVAESRVVLENAATALAEAEERRDLIGRRIDEKQAERAAIVAARKNGAENPKDGARLMTITVDAENLGELLSEAEAVVRTRTRDATEARRILGQAEADLAKASDTELLRLLIENAVLLDGLMLKNIREIADTWKRLGNTPGREKWTPTVELADLIKRIDLTRENRR